MNTMTKQTKEPKEPKQKITISIADNMEPQGAAEDTLETPEESETSILKETISEEKEAPKALKRFAKIMREQGNRSTANEAIGRQLWECWQEYTGRTDRFRGCSACLVNKIVKLKKECDKYGISYK